MTFKLAAFYFCSLQDSGDFFFLPAPLSSLRSFKSNSLTLLPCRCRCSSCGFHSKETGRRRCHGDAAPQERRGRRVGREGAEEGVRSQEGEVSAAGETD